MSRRDFPLAAIRRADAGPTQRGHSIVCAACGAMGHVVNTGVHKAIPSPLVEKKFAAMGWRVGVRADDDLCPACAEQRSIERKKERLPMVKTKEPAAALPAPSGERSDDAILARKICDDLLLERLDMKGRRYQPGWSDARVAKESGWSESAVRARRIADYFEITVTDVPIARIAEIETALGADLGDLHAAWSMIVEAGAAFSRGEQALRKAEAAIKTRVEQLQALTETGAAK